MRVCLTVLTLIFACNATAYSLKVKFSDLKNTKGSVRYLIFTKEKGYPDNAKKSLHQGSIKANEKVLEVTMDLPQGTYALTVIHDMNDNSELDKSFIGVPVEGFGFSNNPRIFFGPPSFKKASFEIKKSLELEVRMKYL